MLVISTLTIAYCKQLAGFFVDLFGGGQGSWDPKRDDYVSDTAIGLAIVSFYLLDFALNALQASLRNLLLDITPADQLNVGNAWHSRMTQAGNIVGYAFGFFPLADIPILRWIGGTQFRKFCIVVLVVLVITVWITCWTQEERERPKRQVGSRYVVMVVFQSPDGLLTNMRQEFKADFGEHLFCGPQVAFTHQEGLRRSGVCIYGMVKSYSSSSRRAPTDFDFRFPFLFYA